MKIIKILPSFEHTLKKLSHIDKEKVKKALNNLNKFLTDGTLPAGLGFKKINKNKYEIRVDIRLRIILKLEQDILYLVLVGNHKDIISYLRKYR